MNSLTETFHKTTG